MKKFRLCLQKWMAPLAEMLTAGKVKYSIIFILVFLILRVIYGYKVYHMVYENFHFFELVFGLQIDVKNLSYIGDFLVEAYGVTSSKKLKENLYVKKLIFIFRNFPTFNLYTFLILVFIASLKGLDFDVIYTLQIAIIDYSLSVVVHYMSHDKDNGWTKCKQGLEKFYNYFK